MMLKKLMLGANIMEDNTMNAVHDDDLVKLLKSLEVYDDVVEGKYKCLYCGKTITLDNIDSIVPYEGDVQFTCDSQECHLKLLGWKE